MSYQENMEMRSENGVELSSSDITCAIRPSLPNGKRNLFLNDNKSITDLKKTKDLSITNRLDDTPLPKNPYSNVDSSENRSESERISEVSEEDSTMSKTIRRLLTNFSHIRKTLLTNPDPMDIPFSNNKETNASERSSEIRSEQRSDGLGLMSPTNVINENDNEGEAVPQEDGNSSASTNVSDATQASVTTNVIQDRVGGEAALESILAANEGWAKLSAHVIDDNSKELNCVVIRRIDILNRGP